MATDQFTFQDPRTQYPAEKYPQQPQGPTGLAKRMTPKPDHGEDSYKGNGRLTGRKAVVTGADSGIGRATAIAFAREGADVVLAYLPQEQADADEVIKLIEEAGRKAVSCPGDLSKEAGCKALIDTAVKQLGGIDILAIIAGKQVAVQDIADITSEQMQQTFAVNVYAMFWLIQAALPHLPPGASIINTTSVQAYNPSPNLLDYAATKAAIANFTKGFSEQAIEKCIRVNAVAPGPIWTPLEPSGGQPQEKIPTFGQQVPYKRAGQPAELAPAYVFLASQESSFVTGEILGVTGGETIS